MASYTVDLRQKTAGSGLEDHRQLPQGQRLRDRRPDFLRLAGALRGAAKLLADGLVMRTNNASALLVLEKRVLQHLVGDEAAPQADARGQSVRALQIQQRHVANCMKADPEYGAGVAAALARLGLVPPN